MAITLNLVSVQRANVTPKSTKIGLAFNLLLYGYGSGCSLKSKLTATQWKEVVGYPGGLFSVSPWDRMRLSYKTALAILAETHVVSKMYINSFKHAPGNMMGVASGRVRIGHVLTWLNAYLSSLAYDGFTGTSGSIMPGVTPTITAPPVEEVTVVESPNVEVVVPAPPVKPKPTPKPVVKTPETLNGWVEVLTAGQDGSAELALALATAIKLAKGVS